VVPYYSGAWLASVRLIELADLCPQPYLAPLLITQLNSISPRCRTLTRTSTSYKGYRFIVMDRSLGAANVATVINRSVDSTTAEANVSVVHLLSPMTFEKGGSILVTCDRMVKIELSRKFHTFVSATNPTTITAPGKFTISPAGCLGPDFARLWNNLPKELKCHILSFNLVIEEPDTSHLQFRDEYQLVLRHLAMGPEIAPLAQRLFYQQNNFALYHCHRYPREWHLPKMALRPLVRHVTLVIGFNDRDWKGMQRLAKDGLGLDNLQTVNIAIRAWGPMTSEVWDFNQKLRAEFKCKGRIELDKVGQREHHETEYMTKVRKLITFAGNK
jgi:hypothetical protein